MDTIIPEIAEAMWCVLNEAANEAGCASGFIKRKKLTGASFVQSLVFGYLAKPTATSAELGQAAATIGVKITRQGIDKRFSLASANCMELVLAATMRQVLRAAPVELDILRRFSGVHLVDSITRDGEPLDLVTWLNTTDATVIDCPIQLGKTLRLASRLIAVRVPDEVVAQRRKRLEAEAQKKGQAVRQDRLDLIHWTLYVTNVPPHLLNVDEAFVLGRSRWQVEMLFKLWKSDGQIDTSRSANPYHILTEFYAKLIAMVIQHWLFLTELWDHPDRSLHQASQVIQKHAFHLASRFRDFDGLCCAIAIIQDCLASCRLSKCKNKRHTFELWLQFNL